jgi:hypothetical protein
MQRLRLLLALGGMIWLLAGMAPAASAASPHDTVILETSKTSIYIGSVTLTMTPFKRSGAVYSADYKARVIPYFFSNEKGHLWVNFDDDQLARLDRGERVNFTGRAENTDREERRIEGFATPSAPGSKSGKIKVKVFVTPKIELIFNTTYRFGG